MCKKLTTDEFIERASKIHPGKYNYDKTVYDGINSYVCVSCLQHGDFTQRADKHLAGMEGCSECHKASYADEGKWSNTNIINEIKALAAVYGYAQAKDSPTSLGAMARRRFGSWEEACRVAGVTPHKEFIPHYTTCTIDGCTRPTRSGTCPWCETHYYRNRRNGDPEKLQLCQYSVDTTIFDKWHDANAWLLGVLWTDGWMTKGNSIGLKLKDLQLLEAARSVMNTNAEIKTAYTKGKEYKYFSIASKPLADRLRELGMYRAKTLTIQYPQELPDKLFWSFLRGVIDGDGTVYLEYRRKAKVKDCRVSFVTGSPAFARQMQAELEKRGIKVSRKVRRKYLKNGKRDKHWAGNDLYCLIVCKQSSLRTLIEGMYPSKDVPCLHRKRDKMLEFYNTPRALAGNPNHKIGFWTDEKLAQLKPLYLDPNTPIKKMIDLFGCKWGEIKWAAGRKLNIKRPCYWSNKDDHLLKNNYSTADWTELRKLFPTRSKLAISHRACVLELERPRTKRPSREVLQQLYDSVELVEIAKNYNVGDDTVRSWLDYHGIKLRRPKFMEFHAARELVRSAKLKSVKEYRQWRLSHPALPYHPSNYEAWVGWPDWLGVEINIENGTGKTLQYLLAAEERIAQWVKIAEDIVADRGSLPFVSDLWNSGKSGLVRVMREYPGKFSHLSQDRSDHKGISVWVALAEKLAAENNGVLQNVGWLQKNGYKALDAAMRRHPKAFAHIKQHRKTKPMTDEVKAKVSAIRKGKPWSKKRRSAQIISK